MLRIKTFLRSLVFHSRNTSSVTEDFTKRTQRIPEIRTTTCGPHTAWFYEGIFLKHSFAVWYGMVTTKKTLYQLSRLYKTRFRLQVWQRPVFPVTKSKSRSHHKPLCDGVRNSPILYQTLTARSSRTRAYV